MYCICKRICRITNPSPVTAEPVKALVDKCIVGRKDVVEVVKILECVEFVRITDVVIWLAVELDKDTVEPDGWLGEAVVDDVWSILLEIPVEILMLDESVWTA